ncbi:MAG: hypothetical protein SFT92_05365 [Rickettsiales bacterium]|nr:hypothetical protein [Rickettsiales bacterium]
MTITALLASYPRPRPPLSEAMQAVYVETYKASREGKGILYALTQYLESWMHRVIAKAHRSGDILEIGAGTLNHLPYEQGYAHYDIIEPFSALFEDSPRRAQIRSIYGDITQIQNQRYARIISVATLEHILDLPHCLARAGLLLTDDGLFQAGIPSEGGFAWGATWRLSVGLSFRLRTGLDYGELMRHEHVNDADEIIQLVRYFFEKVRVKRFPLPHAHLSLYSYIEASKPRLDRCRAYLGQS